MKPKLLFIAVCLCHAFFLKAQSPKLSLVGSNFSFARGNIEVEVLTEIIQRKQDEVMERVFRNMIINTFTKKEGARKSFTTYSYIYNLLYTITQEKNKTVMTRQIINNVLEYCLVYGFTREFVSTLKGVSSLTFTAEINEGDSKQVKVTGENLFNTLETLTSADNEKGFLKSTDNEEWVAFNVLLDMAYDVFLTDETHALHKKGLFKLTDDQPNLRSWYERDNAYWEVKDNSQIITLRQQMKEAYSRFISGSFTGVHLINVYKELSDTEFKQETITKTQYEAARSLLRMAIKALKNYSDNNLIGHISEFLLDYTLIEYAPEDAQNGLGSQGTKADLPKRGILYVDAEGLISHLYDKFASNTKRSPVAKKLFPIIPRPFLVIGATHSGVFSQNNQLLVKDGQVNNLKNIYFANEKIGIKFTFTDKKYTRSFEPGEEFKYHGKKTYWKFPQDEPIITRYELFLYGSGLLYNIVDIKSHEDFNYTLVGAAFGITFFNGLMLNAGAALPVNAKEDLKNKYLYTFSFDIPIIEYINAVRKKRNK